MMDLADVIEAVRSLPRPAMVVQEIGDPAHEAPVVLGDGDFIPSYECAGCHLVWGRRWTWLMGAGNYTLCNACYTTLLVRVRSLGVRISYISELDACLTDVEIEMCALERKFNSNARSWVHPKEVK